MCYTQCQSAALAAGLFAVAAYEHRCWGCWHYSLGLAYFGLMEALQAVQHSFLAVPEDNYAMCKSPTNQFLTWVGLMHIMFQPFFANWAMMGLMRHHHLKERIQSDVVQVICLLGGIWYSMTYVVSAYYDSWSPPATKECPNYNWIRDGYDEALDFVTPNLPYKACTFLSPSEDEHLAWVFPNFDTSYYKPNSFLHFFCMFVAHAALAFNGRPIIGVLVFMLFWAGPMLAAYITPSVNEQAAVWCFDSVFQCIFMVVVYRWYGIPQELACKNKPMIYSGKWWLGEKPIVYMQVATSTGGEHDDKQQEAPLLRGKECYVGDNDSDSDSAPGSSRDGWRKRVGKTC